MQKIITLVLALIMLSSTVGAENYTGQIDQMLNGSYIGATASLYNVSSAGYFGVIMLFFTLLSAFIITKSPELVAVLALIGSGFLTYLGIALDSASYWSVEMQAITYLIGIMGLAFLIWKMIID